MKTIIENLKHQLEALREITQAREDKFYNRSQKWQESEKGEAFEDTTFNIESQADDLETIIEELENNI